MNFLAVKKFLCVLLALFTLMLTGCGGNDILTETASDTTSAEEVTAKEETQAETESETEAEFSNDGEIKFYGGEGYEFSYDSNKWELSFEPDTHNPLLLCKEFELNVTFVSVEIFEYGLETCADGLKDTYDMMGYVCTADEIKEINSTEWLFIDFEKDNYRLHMRTAFVDGCQYTVRCYAEKEQFETGFPDFEDIFDSFKFTE